MQGYAALKAEEFGGDLALVVVHGDYRVEVTPAGGDEEGVGGVGAGHVKAGGLGTFDGRSDDFDFFGAEEAAFSGVGVQAGYGDAGIGSEAGEKGDGIVDGLFGDQVRYGAERYVGSYAAGPEKVGVR